MQLNNTKLQEYDFCYNHLCKVFLRHRFYSFILLGHSLHDLSCCIMNEIDRFLSYFCFTNYFEFHPGKNLLGMRGRTAQSIAPLGIRAESRSIISWREQKVIRISLVVSQPLRWAMDS